MSRTLKNRYWNGVLRILSGKRNNETVSKRLTLTGVVRKQTFVTSPVLRFSGKSNNGDGTFDTCSGGSDGRSKKGEDFWPCPNCQNLISINFNDEKTNVVKCDNCLKAIMLYENEEANNIAKEPQSLPYPKQIHQFLNQYVIGQELPKMHLAVASYNHYKRLKNMKRKPRSSTQRPLDTMAITLAADTEALAESITKALKNSSGIIALVEEVKKNYPQNVHMEKKTAEPLDPFWSFEDKDEEENKVKLEKSNIIMLGPTGSGKTLLVKTLAECLDVPFAMCDCTTLTTAGYVGEDVESVIYRLLENAEFDIDKCERGIIFLDEVDKIRRVPFAADALRDVGGEGVQHGFLKIIESNIVNVTNKSAAVPVGQTYQVDTSNILFIASGAFVGLTDIIKKRIDQKELGFGSQTPNTSEGDKDDLSDIEATNQNYDRLLSRVEPSDLVKYGLIPEFIGRFHVILPLHSLSEELMIQILRDTKNSLLAQKEQLFNLENCELVFTECALKAIAKKAIMKKIGARGLHAILEKLLLEPMYEIPSKPEVEKVIITGDTVEKGEKPQYVYRQPKVMNSLQMSSVT